MRRWMRLKSDADPRTSGQEVLQYIRQQQLHKKEFFGELQLVELTIFCVCAYVRVRLKLV